MTAIEKGYINWRHTINRYSNKLIQLPLCADHNKDGKCSILIAQYDKVAQPIQKGTDT